MATHSSVLAWRIPGTGEPGGLSDVYGVAQSRTRLKRLSSSSSKDSVGKDSAAGRDWGQEEKGMTEDEMAGWHH